jgi:hypothetical protein
MDRKRQYLFFNSNEGSKDDIRAARPSRPETKDQQRRNTRLGEGSQQIQRYARDGHEESIQEPDCSLEEGRPSQMYDRNAAGRWRLPLRTVEGYDPDPQPAQPSDSTQSSPRELKARGKSRPNSPESSRTYPHSPTLSIPKLSGRSSATHNRASRSGERNSQLSHKNVDSNHARGTQRLPLVLIHPHLPKDKITVMSDNKIDRIEWRIYEHSIGGRIIELNGDGAI